MIKLMTHGQALKGFYTEVVIEQSTNLTAMETGVMTTQKGHQIGQDHRFTTASKPSITLKSADKRRNPAHKLKTHN